MIERVIYLEGIDPLQLYGVNNVLLERLCLQYPKVRIIARGNEIKVAGEKEELDRFEEKVRHLIDHIHEYNQISQEEMEKLISDHDILPKGRENGSDILLYSTTGKPISARTPNQYKLVQAYAVNDLIMAIGPAGTGKTYTSIALAVKALKNRQVKRIVLTRPAVEAGEHLGFLPGDMKEKLDPYLQPLYDALNDMIPFRKLSSYLEDSTIQIAPLAFMRGRTLENAFVILDEGQNATVKQLKMFLTRMGQHSKFIITGDITQIDLPSRQQSGLLQAMKILMNIPGIVTVVFDVSDIMRHSLVKHIVKAYDEEEKRNSNGKNEMKNTPDKQSDEQT